MTDTLQPRALKSQHPSGSFFGAGKTPRARQRRTPAFASLAPAQALLSARLAGLVGLAMLAWVVFCAPAVAADAAARPPAALVGPEPMRSNPPVNLAPCVRPGEKLTYIAKWNGFPGGTITTSVWPVLRKFDDRPVYMFEMTMESNDFLSVFYPVRSTIRSLADAQTGRSCLFRRRVREGSYFGNDRVIFEYEHQDELGKPQPLAMPALIRAESVEEEEPRAIPGALCDPLSLVWYMRTLRLRERGDTAAVLIGDRFGNGLVTLTVSGSEEIVIAGVGRFRTLVIRPAATTYGGKESLVKTEGQVRFWLEENTKILLRAEADIPIGRAGVTLLAAENAGLELYDLDGAGAEDR